VNQILCFSDYDVFAYLTSGLAALAVIDLCLSTHFVIAADWSVADGFLTVVASYVLGQLFAAPAQWLIERSLVHRVIGRPTEVLLGTLRLDGWRSLPSRSFLGDYYRPLNAAVADPLRRFMADRGITSGEALFWIVYPAVKQEPVTFGRMEGFLRLYGFCRNLAFVALVAFVLLAVKSARLSGADQWDEAARYITWSIAALVLGAGMLHRYLKFYRLFAVEVLSTFADKLRKETAPT
jgi:hypothetical protein